MPPASVQHFAQHATPSSRGRSFGLAGVQHPYNPLLDTMLVQQLQPPYTTSYIAQHAFYSSPLHQNFQASAYISPHFTPSHGYADPHTMTSGSVTVDPKEHFRVTHTAYAAPALATPISMAATSDALLTRMGDLERALRQV